MSTLTRDIARDVVLSHIGYMRQAVASTEDATPTTLDTIPIEDNSYGVLHVRFIGRSETDRVHGEKRIEFYKVGGDVTILDTEIVYAAPGASDLLTSTITGEADSGSILIKGTGYAGAVNWHLITSNNYAQIPSAP